MRYAVWADLHGIEPITRRKPNAECTRCGEPWPYEFDCCMNPDCSWGARNIADEQADRDYHRMADEEAEGLE